MPDHDAKLLYFLARGRSLDALDAFRARCDAYGADYGTLLGQPFTELPDNVAVNDGRVIGWWPAEPAVEIEGLRRDRGREGILVPNRKTDRGKQIAAALTKLNRAHDGLDSAALTKGLCGGVPLRRRGRGLVMIVYGFERLGDDWVIHGEEGCPAPFDAEPLKRSDYWLRKETSQASPSQASPPDGVAS